jgi:putative addiction module component (TIGR02574 family)
MIKTEELIAEAISLPVEIRAKIIEELLRSLNPARQDIDELWAREAEKRVQEIKAGKVETVSGEEVFKRIKDRLGS